MAAPFPRAIRSTPAAWSRALGPGSRRARDRRRSPAARSRRRSCSAVGRAARAVAPAARYGGIPSWLPKPKVRVGRIAAASAAHPVAGDRGRHRVGPARPRSSAARRPSGRPCRARDSSRCPPRRRARSRSPSRRPAGRCRCARAAFTIVDELGRLHHPRVTGVRGGPPPRRVAHGRTVTLRPARRAADRQRPPALDADRVQAGRLVGLRGRDRLRRAAAETAADRLPSAHARSPRRRPTEPRTPTRPDHDLRRRRTDDDLHAHDRARGADRRASTSGRDSPTSTARRRSSRPRSTRCAPGTTSTRRCRACRRCATRSPSTSAAATGSSSTPTSEVQVTFGATEAIAAALLALRRARRRGRVPRPDLRLLPGDRRARRRARPARSCSTRPTGACEPRRSRPRSARARACCC